MSAPATSPTENGNDPLLVLNNVVLKPTILLMDYTLFIYLANLHGKKFRQDTLVTYMLIVSALSFISCYFLGHPNETVAISFSNMSEEGILLTFVLRIVMVGTEIQKRLKMVTINTFVLVAKIWCIVYTIDIAINFLKACSISINWPSLISNILESAGIPLIALFQLYMFVEIDGFRATFATRKMQILVYVLFVIHEYPFMVMEKVYPNYAFEWLQGVWMRTLIIFLIVFSIQNDNKSKRSKQGKSSSSINPG